MHILLIHQSFAALDEPGGTRHHELARYFAGQGHQVTVVASPVSYLTGKTVSGKKPWIQNQESGNGVTIIRSYTYPALHRSFLHRIFSFLSFMISSFVAGLLVKEVDLVWGTSPPIFQGLTAWALARLKGVPFLFEVRDLWPAFAIAVGVLQNPSLIRISEWLERFLCSHADQVIVNSPGFVTHVQARGARRVEVVPNGADAAMFDPSADGDAFLRSYPEERRKLEGKFIFLYAGAHGLSNDLNVLLDTAGILREQPEIAIVLIGDGKEKPNLIARANQMGLPNVYFFPPVPKTLMPQALAAADACIAILKPVPLYATVYPNKVFDYLAAGRPVILAIDGEIRKVIEQARAGIFVQPGDPGALAQALRTLAANPNMRREMGMNGRRYMEANFDRPKTAEKLARIMENLIKV